MKSSNCRKRPTGRCRQPPHPFSDIAARRCVLMSPGPAASPGTCASATEPAASRLRLPVNAGGSQRAWYLESSASMH